MVTHYVNRSATGDYVAGHTLLELIITISLSLCFLAVATPSFAHIIKQTRVNSASQQVINSLILARSSAINYSQTVLVCQLNDSTGSECVKSHKRNTHWQHGWLVYVDTNKNNVYDEKDNLLQRFQPNSHTAVVFNQNGRLRFFPDGSSRSAGFYICTAESSHIMHIKLLYSGRTRTVKNTSNETLKTCIKSLI